MNKDDMILDAVANLYRAAYYLSLESKETGLNFLRKAKEKLGDKLKLDVEKISKQSKDDYLFWAEKILDEYNRLKMNLS